MLRIYVSSTFKDLVPERQAARDAIHGLGHYAAAMEGYAASDERPLELCLKDLRKCQAYVGLFAWRYGYRPNAGDKSITRLEYEEARARKIPCYIFLHDESAPWPRSFIEEDQEAVKEFREQLRLEHVVATFRDAEDLALAVTQSLARAFPPAESRPPIPEILPHLCDRSDQEFALRDAIETAEARPERPMVCIVHGEEPEGHDKFLERLHIVMLPALLGLPEHNQAIHLVHLEWPATWRDANEFHRKIEWNVVKEILLPPKGNLRDVNNVLQKRAQPTVIHSHLGTDSWKMTSIRDFVNFWHQWPELGVGQTLIVFLFVRYKQRTNLLPKRLQQLRNKNQQIRAAVQNFDFAASADINGFVLPELLGATESEARNWAHSDEASRFCDPHTLVTCISDFYEKWEVGNDAFEPIRIPTSHLAQKLWDFITLARVKEGRRI